MPETVAVVWTEHNMGGQFPAGEHDLPFSIQVVPGVTLKSEGFKYGIRVCHEVSLRLCETLAQQDLTLSNTQTGFG